MVLVDILLMISGIEHLLFFWKNISSNLVPIFNRIVWFSAIELYPFLIYLKN